MGEGSDPPPPEADLDIMPMPDGKPGFGYFRETVDRFGRSFVFTLGSGLESALV